jgi:hypothetical protein
MKYVVRIPESMDKAVREIAEDMEMIPTEWVRELIRKELKRLREL